MNEIRHTGIAAISLGILRPRDARAAAMTPDGLQLTFRRRTVRIAFRDLEAITVKPGVRWARIHFRHAAGEAAISGLTRAKAGTFAAALASGREDWWRQAVRARRGAIKSVHNRLAQMKNPPDYMTKSAGRALLRAARDAIDGVQGRWPDTSFVASEQVRLKAFFDQIESRPLTDEQRRAVVTDDERNLVVAAAGSGKTSVIVAKAGWLVQKGWKPAANRPWQAPWRATRRWPNSCSASSRNCNPPDRKATEAPLAFRRPTISCRSRRLRANRSILCTATMSPSQEGRP